MIHYCRWIYIHRFGIPPLWDYKVLNTALLDFFMTLFLRFHGILFKNHIFAYETMTLNLVSLTMKARALFFFSLLRFVWGGCFCLLLPRTRDSSGLKRLVSRLSRGLAGRPRGSHAKPANEAGYKPFYMNG